VAGCCEFGDEPSGSCATELEFIHCHKKSNIVQAGPYYPLGSTGTAPRAYILGPTKEWKGENIKIKK
jgi:hypothetical protein